MAIHIPPDMIPRMDWNAEDKQAAWAFYRERLEQYFMIAGTPKEAKVTHILFYGGKEASERWTALKDQVEGNKDDTDTVFKAFANSFEKSSSHWCEGLKPPLESFSRIDHAVIVMSNNY